MDRLCGTPGYRRVNFGIARFYNEFRAFRRVVDTFRKPRINGVSKRVIFTTAIVSLAWLFIFDLQLIDAQVTFSRDWNAGKRSVSLPECSIPLRSATSVCQMLVNELRAITNCELKSLLAGRGDENESSSDVFFPPRTG